MTTVAQFAEKLGIRPCDVEWARKQLEKEGEWPGENLTERITITPKNRAAYTKEVRSLSLEQQQAIIGDLINRVESGRTEVEGVKNFVCTYGKERMFGSSVPKEAWSSRDREREEDFPEHPIV